jgi:hypothetical protein
MLGCFAVDFLYTLRGVYLLPVPGGTFVFAGLMICSTLAGVGTGNGFFYYTHIHVLTNCKLLLIFNVISE